MATERQFSVANQEAGNTYQPIRRPDSPFCPTFSSWRGQSSHLKRAAQRCATQSARATSGVFHTSPCKAPTRLAARTGAQVDSSAAAFPGSHEVRTCAASPISRCVWPAKPPVSAACFASEPRTARGMWWSCHGRRISRPRAEMTLAARMSPPPRTAMQQALLFLKNGAFRFRGGGSGCYVFCLSPVLVRILKSSLDAHRGLN